MYTYALTENDGLVYREDETGSARLYPRSKNDEFIEETIGNASRSADDRANGRAIKQRKDGERQSDEMKTEDHKLLEANQLRFVNHQLFSETKGLSIQFNDIFFLGSDTSTSAQQCDSFLKSCSEKQKCRIYGIRFKLLREDQGRVLKFIKKHVNMRIGLHDNALDAGSFYIISNLAELTDWFDADAKAFKALSDDVDPGFYVTPIRSVPDTEARRSFTPNVRLFPKTLQFNEALFRRIVEGFYPIDVVKGGTDSWVAIVKDVFANGV